MTIADVTPLRDPQDAFNGNVESTLSFADEPIDTLRDRILLAMRYTFSWDKVLRDAQGGFIASVDSALETIVTPVLAADDDVTEVAALRARVSAMQADLSALLDMMPLSDTFPGKSAVAAYNAASATFAQLYRDLVTSAATLPQRPLLDQAGDALSAAIHAPAVAAKTLAEQLAQMLKDLLGGTAAAIWLKLWPFIVIAGAAGAVYVFRAPIGRAIKKAAA